jgi:3-hydroxyacyl-CoA dehydrogenase/enoyl-CoA hydratase/3-hydroxybutyryl-CoA epimerase
MSAEPSLSAWRPETSSEHVTTLWFDSPGRSQNVLDAVAFAELDGYLVEIEDNSSIRGVLIRSAKPAGFCAGADLKTIQRCTSSDDLATFLQRGLAVFDRLARLQAPTTAVVHGICLGGGLELALSCRNRVALASSVTLQMGCPEMQLGLVPAWGAMVRMARLLAPRDALNLLLTGNPIGFLQAKSQGLVDRLVTEHEQERIVETLQREPRPERRVDRATWNDELKFAAAKAQEQPAEFPEAQQAIMELIEIDLDQGLEAAKAAAVDRCTELGMSPSTQDAIAVFFQRRRARS